MLIQTHGLGLLWPADVCTSTARAAADVCTGTLRGAPYAPGDTANNIAALSLLATVSALRTFGRSGPHARAVMQRESGAGVNRLAVFVAADTLEHAQTLLKSAVYLAGFWFVF